MIDGDVRRETEPFEKVEPRSRGQLDVFPAQFFDSIRHNIKRQDNDDKFLLNKIFTAATIQKSIDAIIKNLSQLKLQLSNLEQSPSRIYISFCRRALEIKNALEGLK